MNHWLFKSDPDVYSWHDLLKDKKTTWDGVSNNLALKHLRAIKKGDDILIYHSGDEKAIVGIAKAVSNSYPDPTGKDVKLVVVDIEAKEPLPRPVTLQEIKQNKKLSSWELVRFSRLSVMPVSSDVWGEVLRFSADSVNVLA